MSAGGRAEAGWRGPRGRGRRLIVPLRLATLVAFVLAVGALAAPGDAGGVLGGGAVTVLVGVPVLRVAFLARRWWQLGDHPYAHRAIALLGVLAAGATVALVRAA